MPPGGGQGGRWRGGLWSLAAFFSLLLPLASQAADQTLPPQHFLIAPAGVAQPPANVAAKTEPAKTEPAQPPDAVKTDPADAPPATVAPPPAPTPAVVAVAVPGGASPADLHSLLDTLQDDGKRQALIKTIQSLLDLQKAAAKPASPPSPSLADDLWGHVQAAGVKLAQAESVLIDAPDLWNSLQDDWADPQTRHFWTVVGGRLAVVLGAALLGDIVVRLSLTGARKRLASWRPRLTTRRLLATGGLALIECLPVVAFALLALTILPLVHPRDVTKGITQLAIEVNFTARLLTTVLRMFLVFPYETSGKFLPLKQPEAARLFRWLRLCINWAVYGFGLCEVAWWLNMPDSLHSAMQKLVALTLTVIGVSFVMAERKPVAAWLRPPAVPKAPEAGTEDATGDGRTTESPPPGPVVRSVQPLRLLRGWLADIWHALAATYLVGTFLVYALEIEGGFAFLAKATLLSALVVTGAALIGKGLRYLEGNPVVVADLTTARPSGHAEQRIKRYVVLLAPFLRVALRIGMILLLLQVWGVDVFGWLRSLFGGRTADTASRIGTIMVLAFLVWEVTTATIERYLHQLDTDGHEIARSARVRTLLPLLRNALWIILLALVTLVVLSQIGVDIGPLLAGAGVIGLAVGFGSQTLVKDLITGLFLLIEDTVAVGDAVDLGGGHSGTIEAISIRTIRLRDTNGALHTIPFSAVTDIVNQSRGYAFFWIDLRLSVAVKSDKACELLTKIGEEMRQDAYFSLYMIEALEIIGMTELDNGAYRLQARIRTPATKQGIVGREFRRRLKLVFETGDLEWPGGPQTIDFSPGVVALIEKMRAGPAAPPAPAK